MEIIKSKNIKNEIYLLSLPSVQSTEGLNNSKVFIANNSERVHRELYQKHGSLTNLKTKLNAVTKVEFNRNICFSQSNRVEKCESKWYDSAKQRLKNNNTNAYVFAAALRDSLANGRGKGRNIIYGPGNLRKTFILNPLVLLFLKHLLTHPASSKLALEQKKQKSFS